MTTPPRLTKEQAAILGAFTGFTLGPFGDIQEYAERLFGEPLVTSAFASKAFAEQLREKARHDVMNIIHERGE